MNLDVESLRTLLAVLDHGGMTAAAKHLDLSQSAVSWKIKRLEERAGKPLLIRDGHSLRPSTEARALIDDARTIVEVHDRAVNRLRMSELSGTVRLASDTEIRTDQLALVLGRFKRTHPAVSIEFQVGSTERLHELLNAGDIDVGLIQVDDDAVRTDDVILWSDQLVWAVCCETPYEDGSVPLITFGESCFYRPLSEPMLKLNQIDYNIAFSGTSALGVQSAVAAGLGVAVLGSRSLGEDIVEWERGRALGKLPCVNQVVRSSAGDLDDAAQALVDAITTELVEAAGYPA
jgi:DNA-binding transcriptional LysR family regulator